MLSEDLEKLSEDRDDLIDDQEMLNEDLDKLSEDQERLSEDQEKMTEDLDLAFIDDGNDDLEENFNPLSYIFRGKRQTFDPWDMYEARLIPGTQLFSILNF